VRFASVYRSFQDIEAFRDEVDKLRTRRRREPLAGQLSLLGGEADAAGKPTPKGAAPVVGKPPRRSH
jgi:transcriptional repressor NrdR